MGLQAKLEQRRAAELGTAVKASQGQPMPDLTSPATGRAQQGIGQQHPNLAGATLIPDDDDLTEPSGSLPAELTGLE